MEAVFDLLLGLGSERADRALKCRLLGYGIIAGSGPDLPYGQYRRAQRVDVPTHDRLQAVDDLVGHHYGVDGLVGFASVSALPLNRHLEAVGGTRHHASPNTHLSPTNIAVWASCPQACITPSTFETKACSFSSCMGNASISALKATVLPGLLPSTTPSTPVFA